MEDVATNPKLLCSDTAQRHDGLLTLYMMIRRRRNAYRAGRQNSPFLKIPSTPENLDATMTDTDPLHACASTATRGNYAS